MQKAPDYKVNEVEMEEQRSAEEEKDCDTHAALTKVTQPQDIDSNLSDSINDFRITSDKRQLSVTNLTECVKRFKVDGENDTGKKSQHEFGIETASTAVSTLSPQLENTTFVDLMNVKPGVTNTNRPVKKLRIDNNKQMAENSRDNIVKQAGIVLSPGLSQIESTNSGINNSCGQTKKSLTDNQKGLQHCLIEFYEKFHNWVPVSPLMEETVVPLEEFYVKPPLQAVDLRHPFGHPQEIPNTTHISSLKELFYNKNDQIYGDIYITADAGMGKTLLCKYICMTWCRSHDQNIEINEMSADICALRSFEFLFYISLRDVDRQHCKLDDFIEEFTRESLSGNHEVKNILDERTCLILIDGLDEWNHPKTCTKRKHINEIPHRKLRKNCTIVTTMRPWKFDVIRVLSNSIDCHININTLDREMMSRLVTNAINLLNKKSVTNKTFEDFKRTFPRKVFRKVRDIPYIYLQGVCLWFDNLDMGCSQCEIYTNIIELTLNRGVQKIELIESPLQVQQEEIVPKCMEKKELCIKHMCLLLKIGKLAFYALFENKNSPVLVFDDTFAFPYLSQNELEYCLKLGLLSQNKCYGYVSKRVSTVSFQHKTLQEYFAALFMQSTGTDQCPINEDVTRIVVQSCSTLPGIFEMSEIFIFLSGFKSRSYSYISRTINDAMQEDIIKKNYRLNHEDSREYHDYHVVFKFQKLQVQCAQEIDLSEQALYALPLEDVLINAISKDCKYVNAIHKIIQENDGNIKSVSITNCESAEVSNIIEKIGVQCVQNLVKLELWAVLSQQNIERLTAQSANTLQCLVIRNLNFNTKNGYSNNMIELSKQCEDSFQKMHQLQSLWLGCFILTHDQLEIINRFISCSKMTKIYISDITCSTHGNSCHGAELDLSKLKGLQVLGLVNLPILDLRVNIEHLQECKMGSINSSVVEYWLKCLPAARKLSKLRCFSFVEVSVSNLTEIYPSLLQLGRLEIYRTYLGDSRLITTIDMHRFEKLYLHFVSMTCTALREMINSVSKLKSSVTIMLLECTVMPEEEFEMIKRDIREKPESFTVMYDKKNSKNLNVFQFRTTKQCCQCE